MPRALQRSGSNSLASLLRAEPADDAVADDNRKRGERDGRRRGSARRRRRRSCLRLPLGAAGGCRVCDCDEMDSAAPAAAPRRRPAGNDGEDEEEEDGALQCFSWKKGAAAAAAVSHRPSGAGADVVVVVVKEASSVAVLPDDVMEMVLGRLPLASLLAARCVCRRWRDLTVAPQFLRVRRKEGDPGPRRAPWLFLFGVDGDVGWGAAPAPAVHALDVAAHRWRRIGAGGLKGRFLFSVAGVEDDLYVVGGRSGGTDAGGNVKTHKGVLVFSPLTGSWRKAAPMRTARSRPVLGVFEMSSTCSILHARAEKHVRWAKSRLGGASAVYEDPHRLSLRRLRLKDMLNEDTDSTELASSHDKSAGQEGDEGQPRLAIVAVGGRGHWDEPLVSGEIYDPLIDKWVEIAGFPTDVGLACSGAVCGRMFYVYCESDTLVAYHLDKGSWVVVQTSRPPPRLRDYAPTLACCASRLFMLCVSWCDRQGPVNRREKVVRKLFELDLASLQWTEAAAHPDAPMDPNAAFAVGRDRIYAVEMFRIFGKVLDFVTACRVSDTEQKWSRIGRENAATEADAMSCRLKSMAVLHL
ncbi:F-box/kelch-repeat protein [Panicum miliaceum]|uniref:F-box/kelch-repeat protein n=1 Tax=Panicum miliaceum TaxID=4540 RepID=A0A3L6T4E2_PANMI|nr:F-box/kelch-repeat protein [Panicum miliaceum]